METDRYVFGYIPFGEDHERPLGRILAAYYRVIRGFVFAGVLFAIAYWGHFGDIDSVLHFLVFVSLAAHRMEGSTLQQKRRIADYVESRLGEDTDE